MRIVPRERELAQLGDPAQESVSFLSFVVRGKKRKPKNGKKRKMKRRQEERGW